MVVDCIDLRKWRVLEFVIPILYPEKPTWIIVTLTNTIFSALFGVRKVSWRLVLQKLVGKLVSRLEKEKPSPISPYVFHLYNRFECLREGETMMLETTRYMLEFDVALEAGAQSDPKEDDSDWELLSSSEIQRL